jgi:septal ring factor EnvC (AmiA/AmiB activator)
MNDQQKIDVLNTLIAQYESAVWLRDVLKDALKLRDEAGNKEAILADLDKQVEAKQADLAGLTKKYQAKEAALEKDLDALRQTHAAAMEKLMAQAHEEENHLAGHKESLDAQVKEAQETLAKVQGAIATASKKQEQTELALARAVTQYEDYKASLK